MTSFGKLEIIVESDYCEGVGYLIYDYNNGKYEQVLGAIDGA